MKIIEHSTIAAHEQLGRILSEFCCEPDDPNVFIQTFDVNGIKLTIKRLVQSGLGLANERWDHWRIDGLGDIKFHDYRLVTLVPVID